MRITVVTEDDERTFNADGWEIDVDKTLKKALKLITAGVVVAYYVPGTWRYVLQADSEIEAPP